LKDECHENNKAQRCWALLFMRFRKNRFTGSLQPAFDRIATKFLLPGFQGAVIAAFGLDHFAAVRILVALELTRFARLDGRSGRRSRGCTVVRVQNRDHLLETDVVFGEQLLELGLELDFALEARIILHLVQLLQLRRQLCFQRFELCQLRHDESSYSVN
jgi:hypothetical protein